jgi:hypothetical protein
MDKNLTSCTVFLSLLSALKLIVESNEARFKLLLEGPSILAVKSLEDRLNKIEIAGQISH